MTTTNNLFEILKMLVAKLPGLTGREYARHLRNNGFPYITKNDVNRLLYSNKSVFYAEFDEIKRPSWFLESSNHQKTKVSEKPIQEYTDWIPSYREIGIKKTIIKQLPKNINDHFDWKNQVSFNLWDWQIGALNKWQESEYIGVVAAVTGSGKTKVAIGAIELHYINGWQILVVVNKIVLQEQWIDDLVEVFGESFRSKIGRLGNGYKDDFKTHDIIIAIVNSAAINPLKLSLGRKGLIVADECHHYEAEQWFKAMKPHFTRRLGLTATYEPDIEGETNENLDSYFGGPVMTLEFDEAIDNDIISHFTVEFIGTELTSEEREKYDKAQNQMSELGSKLNAGYDVKEYGDFFAYITWLSKNGEYPKNFQASKYLGLMRERRNSIIESKTRLEAFKAVFDKINSAKKSFVFTESIEATERLNLVLNHNGILSTSLHSDMSQVERISRLEKFGANENYKVLVAPKLLDEGVNIPSANLAVIYASTKSKRQMIQRLGRVLRKAPGKVAKIIIFYAYDTYEDPRKGTYENFINMVQNAADDVFYYRFKPLTR